MAVTKSAGLVSLLGIFIAFLEANNKEAFVGRTDHDVSALEEGVVAPSAGHRGRIVFGVGVKESFLFELALVDIFETQHPKPRSIVRLVDEVVVDVHVVIRRCRSGLVEAKTLGVIEV